MLRNALCALGLHEHIDLWRFNVLDTWQEAACECLHCGKRKDVTRYFKPEHGPMHPRATQKRGRTRIIMD